MYLSKIEIGAALMLATFATSCGGERAENKPPSYQTLKEQELQSEREEYLRDHRERLSDVEREMQHVQAKLDHESKFVDESQKASWRQQLFELRQEKMDLQAQIDRAQTASPEDWEKMRGTIGTATDSLQAGVRKLRAEVSQALALNGGAEQGGTRQAEAASKPNLCVMNVPGADAKVDEQGNRVMVTVTTKENKSVADLQRKASELAKTTEAYGSAATTGTPGAQPEKAPTEQASKGDAHQVEVDVSVKNVDDGVKITFTPKREDSADALLARLKQDAARLTDGQCAPAEVSMRTKP